VIMCAKILKINSNLLKLFRKSVDFFGHGVFVLNCLFSVLLIFLLTINSDLCVCRYQPHVARNLTLARAPANLTDFTAYMNGVAMFVRGGDISIQRAR